MAQYNLARAFRPQKFADLIGQTSAVQILKNIVKNNLQQQAFILVGTRGVGKTTIARIIAKALNCNNVIDGEPCGTCDICLQIENGSFMDCIEIDAASNTGVDNIREILDNSYFVPNYGRYKVYIIDEVHMLSKSAFNAMLKTLEEPPAHAVFILATTELNKVPITILSRCLQLSLRNLSAQEIADHVANLLDTRSIKFDIDALAIIAQKAAGSMRDALSITDRACAYSDNNITTDTVKQILDIADRVHIINLIKLLVANDKIGLVNYANQLIQNGVNLNDVMLQLAQLLCDIQQMQLAIIPIENELVFCKDVTLSAIQMYFEICNICLEQMQKSINPNAIFIMCLIRMLVFSTQDYAVGDINVSTANINNSSIEFTTDNTTPPKLLKTVISENTIKIEAIAITEIPLQKKTEVIAEALDPQISTELSVSTEQKISLSIEKSSWPQIVQDIIHIEKVSEFIQAVLQQTELLSYENSKFILGIEANRLTVINDNVKQQILQLFNQYFNSTTIVEFVAQDALNHTLKQHYKEEEDQKENLRQEIINNDPIVQEIVAKFDAKIIG